MSEKIVTRVLPKLKVTRTSYLAKESYLTNLEGKSRKLFSPDSVSLGHTAAANYLRGPQGGKTAFEIIVSPEETKFLQSLGGSPKENFQQIVFASRLAMDKLLEEVNAGNARWVGVFHQNTEHTHLHILIAEEFSDDTGNKKSIRRIPKNLLYKDEENLSALDRKFLKAFKEHFIVKPLDSPTIINGEAKNFLPPLAEKYQAEAIVAMMSRFPFSLSTLNQASENGSLVSDDNARPVFVRRNAEGVATGSVWFDEEGNFWRRKVFENGGWFYIGDLRQAESIILVSSPDEALALQTLHSDRNLEKAAIIALEPRKLDAELGDLLIERQSKLRLQNKQLNVVWATNLNPKGRQIQTGLFELKNYTEKKLRFKNLPQLRFTPYSRNSSWTKQLQIVTDAAEIINIIEPHQEIKRIPIPQDIIFTQPLPPFPKLEVSQKDEVENSDLKPLEAITNSADQTAKPKLTFAELTERARNVSLETVAKIHGLRETLENGELFWQDSAGTRSIKITDNIFSDRKNKMRGGRGAIDFVAYLQDLAPAEAFKAARAWLIENQNLTAEPGEVNNKTANPGEQNELLMPLKVTENLEYVRFYLEESRGVAYQTINKFIENDLLFANSFASAVFVHRDLAGFINGASWRDTTGGSTLRGNAPGSDKENGYFYVGDPNTAEKFVLVEAPIDLLSYYEIEAVNGVDLSKTAIISLGGLNVTPSLLRHLSDRQIVLSEENKTIEIIFATDDDSRGEKAFDRFLDKFAEIAPDLFALESGEIEEKVNLIRHIPPAGKDWNDYLKRIKDKLEFPTLEEINENLSEAQIDPTENLKANIEDFEREENLSLKDKEVSITETFIEEKNKEEISNEHQPIENGEPSPRLATNGDGLSGGINSESLQTGESGRDSGTDLSESGGESGTQVSGSPEQLFKPLGSDGIGESGDQANPRSGGLGTELTDEKVYKFKIRPQGDEFLQYKIGLNPQGEWQTSASGLIGSKDQTAKKVQFIELEAETKANEKLESISQAVGQINAQIRVLDNNRNEYSPLYQEIYRFHRDFLEKFTPQIDLAKEVLPSDIRNVYQKEEGFKVVFQDQKYPRSFSFRDENGSILDRERVREKAATWRKECEKRSAIINDSAEYSKDFESIILFNEGKNRLQAKIVFDEFDNLWRGLAAGEVFSGVHQFRLTDKPVTFLHQGFADKNELLSNLVLKVTNNLENRINLISKEAETKMFQSAILGLELKRNEILGIEVEDIKDEAIQPDQTFVEEENQTIFVDDGNRTKQNLGFRRSENGEIQIQNIQSVKREGLTVLELTAFDESLANPILDYLENGEIKTRLWFTDAENLRQPLITLSDLPTAENQIVVLQKTNKPFSLTQFYDLPTLRRINLAAARDAEIRAFDLETTATAGQKVKGEIFYSSLIKETSERIYDNLFGLLGENEQLTVLAEIENQLKDFGFDSIVNTTKQNGKEINFLRVLAGNWTSIGRLTGKTLDLVLDEEIASNNPVQYRKLEDGLTSEIGDYTLSQIFRYDGNPALRAGVKSDIQAWTVYLAGTSEQLENLRKFALEEYQTELKFEPLLEETELKYAQTFDKKPFDLSLDDYIAKREFTAILRIQSEINGLRERNADLSNLDKPNFRQGRELQQNEILLNHYFDQLANNEVVSDDNRKTFADEYVIAVNRAIKQGLVIPSRRVELALENPLFKKSVENRQRVEKGKTIAYLKETASLDYSLQDEFGVTIRRQDNQTLAAGQKEEIKKAVLELENVFGSLKAVFTKGEISIVHTNGKQPASSTKPNELPIGIKINGIEQRKFASYFAQWLDREAGLQIGGNDLKASLSEIETSPNKLNDQFSVIKEAWKLSRKQEIYGVNTFKDISINKPGDIFARLVEQYVSTKLENQQFVVESDYSEKFGFWSKQNFAKLIPEIEAELNKRLGLVEKSLNLENLPKFAAPSNEPALSLAEEYEGAENPIPEIDLAAYRQATEEDRNYFEDENNFSPREVRADYFQETFALADSVLALSEAVKVIPTSKSGERDLKKNQEKLKFDEGNLSFHVFQTGKYFGELSEEYLRRELLKKNLEFTDDYKLVIGKTERVDLLEIKQKEKETSFKPDLFQVEFKEFFGKDSRYQLSSYRHQGTIAGIPPLDGLQITRDSKPIYVITPNQNGDWRLESVREKAGKQVYGLLINGMERIRKVFGHCVELEDIKVDSIEQTIPQSFIEKNEAFAAELQNRLGDSFKVEAGLETDSINADVYSIEELFSVYLSETNTLVTVFGYDSGDFYTPPDWIEKYSTEFASLDEAVLRIKAKTVFDEKAFRQQILNELKRDNIELLFNKELNPDRDEAKVNFEAEVQSLINSKIENDFRYQFLKTDEINQLFLELESSTIQADELLFSEDAFNLQEKDDSIPPASQTINDSKTLDDERPIFEVSSQEPNPNLPESTQIESLTEIIKQTGLKKREFAELHNLSGGILYNLEFRVMEFETIPPQFIAKIAQAVNVSQSALEDYLKLPNSGLPLEGLSFTEAIRNDEGLTAQIKQIYLNYASPESNIEIIKNDPHLDKPFILNEKEHQVFISLTEEILGSTGGQFGYAGDARIPDGMTSPRFAGYVSQLTQKGFFDVSDDEFKQLTIGENFTGYANQNNLFVGETFEKGFDWIEIKGSEPQISQIQEVNTAASESKAEQRIETLEFDFPADFHHSYTPANGYQKKTFNGTITSITVKPAARHNYGRIIPTPKPTNDLFYTIDVQTNEFPEFQHRIIFNGSQQAEALELIKNNTLAIGSEIGFTAYINDALEKGILKKGSGSLPTNVLSISYLERKIEIEKRGENTQVNAPATIIEPLEEVLLEEIPTENLRVQRKPLLLPDVFDVSFSELETYQQIAAQLDFQGFETLQLSGKTIAVKTVPLNYTEGETNPREQVLEYIRNPHLLTEASNLSLFESDSAVVGDTQTTVNQKMKELMKLPLAERVLVINNPSEYISLFEAEALVENGGSGFSSVKGYDVEMDADWINSNVVRIELNNVSPMLAKDILSLTRENLVDKLEIIRDGQQIYYFDPVEADKKLVESLNAEEDRRTENEPTAQDIQEILFDDLLYTERQRTGFFAAFLNGKIEEKLAVNNLGGAELYDATLADDLLKKGVTKLALRINQPSDNSNLIVLFHPGKSISVVEEKSYSPEDLAAFLEKKTGSFLDEDSWKYFQNLEQAVDYIADREVERVIQVNDKSVIPEENKVSENIDSLSPSLEKQSIKWGSKILPDHLLNQMPVQQKRETVDDYEVYAKLFHPLSSWTMFVTEAEAVRNENEEIVDVNLFGFVHTDGINDEWGYSSLKEIDNTTVRGLKTERDLYFDRGRFEDVWRQFRKERGMFEEEEQLAKEFSETAEITEIGETNINPAVENKNEFLQNELLFESIEITFSESPDIDEGKYFLSVEDFDEFLATTNPPANPELYYKMDFTAILSDGSRFEGKLDLQQGQHYTLKQIIREDLESAKTVLRDFPQSLAEQNELQTRIELNENFLDAISKENKSNSREFVDFSQFLPEEITQHLESNRPFSISRVTPDKTRIQVERFITTNENSFNISGIKTDGTEKQVVFAYDQEKKSFFFDKLLTSQKGIVIDKSTNLSEAQEIINSIAFKNAEETEAKPGLNQYRITDLELHDSGLKAKFRNNVEAIKLLRQIEEENRLATSEEQEILAKFSGWGGLKNAFDVYQPKEDWKNEIKELQILLSDNDEYFAARQSTENAHYTSAEFAGEMWKIAQKLGFSGGCILEPAVGDGIFIGTMPEELSASSKVIAVEKEAYSARLTKQLYQRSEVINSGFEKTSLKENSFDLVISNFPFGSYTVHDPAYNSLSPSIHDYFFLKSLDKVKEGGLVVALTSRFTMDKTDSSIREAIARRAELVGAFRLPETAFQDNAHTSVVTDLLIFQKRPKGQEIDKEQIEKLNWIKSDFLQLNDETYHNVNQYFHENPNNIWGKTSSEGRMYGRNELTVKSENKDDYLALAKAARENLEPVFTSNPIELNETDEQGLVFSDHSDKKIGSLFITNSRAYRQTKDGAVELYLTPKELEKAAALISVRETIKSIYKTEIENGDAEEQRAELNQQYDSFRQKYGIINRPDNLKLLEGDPEIYLVKTLEGYFDVKTGRAEKAEVFFQSTLKGYEKPESSDNITQALAISLNETGKVNLERIAELLSVTQENVISEIKAENRAFLNPATKEWDLAEKYLSGNVRQKLAEAQETASISAENEVLYRQNIEELIKVQPKDLDYLEIEPVIGAPWIPKSDIKDFLLHLTKADESAIRLENAAATGQWAVSWSGNAASKSAKQKDQVTKIWGTGRADTIKIVQAALDGRPLHITDTHSDGDKKVTVTNVAETEMANQKLMEVKQEFKDWIWSDPARRTRLHRDYNDNYNNFVERKYDGSHLTLPNSNPNIILRPHQKDAVWRAMQEPTVYFGHEVGTGKTLVLGAAMIEKKRLGQVRKPVIPCLKANIKQVTQQIQELYPTARIFTGDGAFEAENRKTEIAALANNNYDLIILTYNQFDSIPIGKETQKKYIKSELSVLEQSIAFAYESEGKKSRLVSKLNKRSAALETQLEKVLAKPKDDVLEFEETGIDYIAIDEAHSFKSLPIYTTMNGIKGIPTSRSDRATNMQMRTEFLREKHGQGRLIMASGTPVTNTVAELYNVMVFTMPETLEKRNIRNFDDFARSYTEIVTKIEPTVTGEYKEQSRLAKFINTPELRALAGNVLDIVKAEDAGVVRPQRKDIVISVPISQEQIEYRDLLKERAFNMKNVDPWVDNHLKLMNDGRLMSLDMRLVDEGAEDDPHSKVNYLVANVLRIADEKPGATQLIFSNLGIHENDKTGHSVFNDVVSKLAEGGIPRTRIANFAKLSPTKRKEAIEKLNSGEILVALGSTETLGTGVNAQKFIAAAHNLDVPWLPAAVEQRDGRSVRNGNIFAELDEDIELYRYVTVGSFDELGWTIIDRKMNFINQIVTNNLNGQRTFEEPDSEEFSAAQISAIASGNPDVMKRIELNDNIKRLESMEKRHKQTNLDLADEIPGKEAFLESRKSYTEKLELDYELYRVNRDKAGDKFKITLDGNEYTEIDKVSRIFAKEMQTCTKRKEIGEFYGFTVVVEQRTGAGWSLRYPSIALESTKTNLGYDFKTDDPEEIASSMSGQLARLKRAAESNKMTYSKSEKELDAIKEQVSRPFRFSEELKEAREEIKEVDERLKNWKEEQAKMEEVKAELKVTVLQGEAEEKAQSIKEKLIEIIEERPKIEVAPFISKDHTEALIKWVEASVIIAQNANRRETEILVEDEVEETELQPGLFSNIERIDNNHEEKMNNDLFSVVEEKDENPKPQEPQLNSEINNNEVKEVKSKSDARNEEFNNPTEKSDKVGLSDEAYARLQAQIIVAQADLSELKYDAKINDLREGVGKRFEVFADAESKEKPIERIEFLRLDSTNKSLINDTNEIKNPNFWSLTDVGEVRQILTDSLIFIEDQQKEQNQEKWRNEENLKNLFENHFNPFKMVKNQLNTLTPEGMVNNFKLNLNPLASIENHPVIQLVKSINDAQNAHQKGLLLEKAKGEIGEKLETLETNVSRQVIEQIDLQKQSIRTSIVGKEKEIAGLKENIPEGVQVKANFTTEELEKIGVVALKTGNHSLMYEYQKAMVEKAGTLETDKLRFQAEFENKDIDKYATRSMLELEKNDVTEQQAANLIRRGGVQPKNLLDAFKQLADLQGNGKGEELIEAHRKLGKDKFSPVETFDKSDVLSHLEGQKIIANAHHNELQSEFKQRFIDGGIKSEPILVSVRSPFEENEIQKSLSKPVWQGESDPLLQTQKQQAIEGLKNQAGEVINDAKRMSDYLNELSVSFRDDLIKAGANKNLMPQISQKEAELVDFNIIEGKVNVYDAPLNQMLETRQETIKPPEINSPTQQVKNLEQETIAKATAQVVEMQESSIAEEAGMLFL